MNQILDWLQSPVVIRRKYVIINLTGSVGLFIVAIYELKRILG